MGRAPSERRSERERRPTHEWGRGLNLCYIDWHVTPFRADRWYEIWEPGAARALAFGAKGWSLSRSIEDPQLFRQSSLWDDKADFDRYWGSDEVIALREQALNYYAKPVLPVWHKLIAGE